MKKYLIHSIIALSLIGCIQNKKVILHQNEKITAANIVDKISQQVKHYPKEPIYALKYGNNYCYFLAYVNDILVHKHFNGAVSGSAFDINQAIFKSGPQKITYKMYAVGRLEGDEEVYDSLLSESFIEFKLGSYDLKNESEGDVYYSAYKTPGTGIAEANNPTASSYKFEGAGKSFFEESFTINVDVPYQLDTKFLQARDLRKIPPEELEKKLLTAYGEIKDIYDQKDMDNIARLAYDKLLIEFVSTYKKSEEIKNTWEAVIHNLSDKSFQMQPLENYKMEFFADGRLVALMSTANDLVLRGETALWGKYKNESGWQAYTFRHFFYIPKGENNFKVY